MSQADYDSLSEESLTGQLLVLEEPTGSLLATLVDWVEVNGGGIEWIHFAITGTRWFRQTGSTWTYDPKASKSIGGLITNGSASLKICDEGYKVVVSNVGNGVIYNPNSVPTKYKPLLTLIQ